MPVGVPRWWPFAVGQLVVVSFATFSLPKLVGTGWFWIAVAGLIFLQGGALYYLWLAIKHREKSP